MNRLKLLREEKGLYQSDIAKYLGISVPAVGYYENEKRDMSPEVILKLAEYFDVSTDYLLGKSNLRNNKLTLDDIDVAFASGIRGLNKENQETLKNIIEGLLAKQNLEKSQNNKWAKIKQNMGDNNGNINTTRNNGKRKYSVFKS